MADKLARVDWRGADLRGVNMAGINLEVAVLPRQAADTVQFDKILNDKTPARNGKDGDEKAKVKTKEKEGREL